MKITKEKFQEYISLQNDGMFNMLDYNSYKPYTNLSRQEWFEIISNYSKYKEQFS